MPLISYLVGISGQPPSLIRYGVTLLSGFPIGVAYRFIPREQILAKHLLSIITTIAMFMLAFNVAGLLHVLAAGTYVWLITRFYGTKLLSPIMCFVILMIHLSYVHFVAQILRLDDPSFVDSSAPMMVLVMKLSSFAWSVYDGSKPPKELNTDQKTYAVTEHPSLVSYFGYCLFFCGVWIGPAFEFKTYDQFITEKGQFEKQRISLVHMAQVLAIALVALGINLYLSPTVHYRHCTESFFREEFSFIQRMAYIQAAAIVVRCQFYAGWKMAEAVCAVNSIAYSGDDPVTKKPTYNRAANVYVKGVELAENGKSVTDSWNCYTNRWLKRCIYERIPVMKTFGTYLGSAIWHGFKPGFYLTFISATLLTSSGRAARKHLRPLFTNASSTLAPYKSVYDILGIVGSVSLVNYFFIPFMISGFWPSVYIWKDTYFVGHLGALLTIFLLENQRLGSKLAEKVIQKEKLKQK